MNIDNLKEKMVLFNPKNNTYIQIKEITRVNNIENRLYICVCSDECDFFSDAQTTIGRQILKREDLHNYFYLDPMGEDFK